MFVENGGYYSVAAVPTPVSVTLTNLGYTGNAAPAANVPSSSKVSPAGIKGADGNLPGGAFARGEQSFQMLRIRAPSRGNLGHAGFSRGHQLVVKNSNWSGTALAGWQRWLGATVTAWLAPNLKASLSTLSSPASSTQGASANEMYYTSAPNVIAVLATTTFGRSALTDADAPSFRARMGGLLPRYGCLGFMNAVNLNAANSDNALTIESARYRLDKITVENASVSLTTATLGVFTAAGGGGTTVAADQSLASLTASSKFHDLTLGGSVTGDVVTSGTLYLRNGSAQGGAATADIFLFGWKYD